MHCYFLLLVLAFFASLCMLLMGEGTAVDALRLLGPCKHGAWVVRDSMFIMNSYDHIMTCMPVCKCHIHDAEDCNAEAPPHAVIAMPCT